MAIPAMEHIFKKYRDSIYRYHCRMCGNLHQADELTQETFYRALLSLARFKGESALYNFDPVNLDAEKIKLSFKTSDIPVDTTF